jgi:uncharacterized protein
MEEPEVRRAHLSLACARTHAPPLALLAILTVLWCVVMSQVGRPEMYTIVGGYALLAGVLVIWLFRAARGAWFRCRARDLAIGVGVGVVMTVLTYPLYRLAVQLVPALAAVVAQLYRSSHQGHWLTALAWLVVIIGAEELLFRGAWLAVLSPRLGTRAAVGLSVALYAAAQAFSGSLVVALLALCCGMLWTLERVLTGSLLAPLISHLIWTPTTILLRPVIQP